VLGKDNQDVREKNGLKSMFKISTVIVMKTGFIVRLVFEIALPYPPPDRRGVNPHGYGKPTPMNGASSMRNNPGMIFNVCAGFNRLGLSQPWD
jgi:hypothetical protein